MTSEGSPSAEDPDLPEIHDPYAAFRIPSFRHYLTGNFVFLIVNLVRAYRGDFTPKQHFGFEAAAWYWHFVDVVWLFLFACIYVWGKGSVVA